MSQKLFFELEVLISSIERVARHEPTAHCVVKTIQHALKSP